jgi:hypothetical protein
MVGVSMSKRELGRLEVLSQVQSGRLCAADVCEVIGLHRRQVFRLLGVPKQDGATSLLSKHRGKIHTVQAGAIVDNKRLSAVLELVKAQHAAYPARQQRGHAARQRPAEQPRGAGSAVQGPGPSHAAAAAPA